MGPLMMVYFVFALSVALLACFWWARGRLHGFGLEALAWNRTERGVNMRAAGFGFLAGLAATGLFASPETTELPPWHEICIGVAIGPLIEELVFRGYLFFGVVWLSRKSRHGQSITVIAVAAIFALSHLAKDGIMPSQIGSIFLTGCMFGWIRSRSGSTTPAYVAHATYNAVIYGAAWIASA